jgi:hypothetical protein
MPEEEFSYDDWKARFEDLQNGANKYGVASMVILSQEDPLNRSESITYTHKGSVIRLLGMMTHTWRKFNSAFVTNPNT